ncbi:MAG TPA: AAA family ATPase, partial [Candidatus Nanopelagicales bacterium]|nr:AAA family ATPase [Candidatus Nanopelagicales bacterium]
MTRKTTAAGRLAPRTSFVGREAELAEIRRRFEAGDRLVTLLGPPGGGKTRLAERFAGSEGGAIACPLGEAQEEGDVVRALARGLDVPLG